MSRKCDSDYRLLIKNLVVAIFLMCSGTLMGQFCGKFEYSNQDGLIQPYDISFVDSKGRLWVDSRGGGLNMFDGRKWNNFKETDGLLYTWGAPIFEDKEGGIWIAHSYTMGASRYVDGVFQQYHMSEERIDTSDINQKLFPVKQKTALFIYDPVTETAYTWHQDSTKNLLIYEFDYDTQEFVKKATPVFSQQIVEKYIYPFPTNSTHHWRIVVDKKGNWKLLTIHNNKVKIVDTAGSEKILAKEVEVFNFAHRLYFSNPDGAYQSVFQKNNRLIQNNGVEEIALPTPNITRYGNKYEELKLEFVKFSWRYTLMSNSNIYAIWKVKNEGFKNTYLLAEYERTSGDLKIIQTTLIQEDKSIGLITKDQSGSYWYCNGSEAVRLFPDQIIVPTGLGEMPPEAWSVNQAEDGNILFSSYRDGLAYFDGLRVKKINKKFGPITRFMDSSLDDSDGFSYFPSDKGILKLNGDHDFEILAAGKLGFYLNRNKKNEIIYGTQNEGLWILPNDKKGIQQSDWKKIGSKKGLKLLNIITALEDQQGNYWMGRGSQGFAIYFAQEDLVLNWLKEEDPENFGLQSMDQDKYGNIWLGTDSGLKFFDYSSKIDTSFKIQNSFLSVTQEYTGNSIIQVCKVYDEHTLIFGNTKGYYLLDLDEWHKNKQVSIQTIVRSSGHAGEGIIQNGIWIDDQKDIWLMCAGGAVRYRPDQNRLQKTTPKVTITKVVNGDIKIKNLDRKLLVQATNRNISIHFDHDFDPTLMGNTGFKYRLNEAEDWSPLSKDNFVNLYNLKSQNYRFEVIAQRNGYTSTPAVFEFKVRRIFYNSVEFWASILGLFIIGAFFFQRNQLRLINQENEMQEVRREKDQFRVQAIVNQLNPHFINNALQWLQIRLDDNEDNDAVKVVGKLSENINAVFLNSRSKKAYHPLLNELKLTENYLYIQKVRFKDRLTYEMPDPKTIIHLDNVMIPLLMIQIHVENGVEHGIRNNPNGGKITVAITNNEDFVMVEITDEGVGRTVAKKIGSHGSQSGTKMLAELEGIYNKQNELAIKQHYIDDIFTDKSGKKFGTKVIITIPKQFDYKL